MGVPHFEEVKWQAPGHLEGETEEELLARRDEQAVAICKTLLDSWSSGAKASVEVITGGITNALFKVTNAELPGESAQKAVILRVFGDNTDLLIDRKKELSVLLQLNKHDFGAKVLTTFFPPERRAACWACRRPNAGRGWRSDAPARGVLF